MEKFSFDRKSSFLADASDFFTKSATFYPDFLVNPEGGGGGSRGGLPVPESEKTYRTL